MTDSSCNFQGKLLVQCSLLRLSSECSDLVGHFYLLKRRCGKVMFSQMSVFLSPGEGVMPGSKSFPGGSGYAWSQVPFWGYTRGDTRGGGGYTRGWIYLVYTRGRGYTRGRVGASCFALNMAPRKRAKSSLFQCVKDN